MSVGTHRYRFRRTWFFDAEPGDVFEVLYAVPLYPGWWPQIRDVRRAGVERFDLVIRSVLPFRLRVRLERHTVDRHRGVLEAGMRGDLAGTSRWQVEPACEGSRVRFAEDMELMKPQLLTLAPAAIPAFAADHAAMMRACHRGLRAALSGVAVAEL
jgi:hypothetical protein